MPQDRKKVAFSSKKKKVQLQQKRSRKNFSGNQDNNGRSGIVASECSSSTQMEYDVINKQPSTNAKYNRNRYNLVFKKEDRSKDAEKMTQASQTLVLLPKEELEVSYEDVFKSGSELDMPKRPPWNKSFSKEVLEAKEQKYFAEYVSNLEKQFGDSLSHFDLNLETWRQLWRVLEFSDIVLLVTDIRHPVFHFSPALYNYVTNDLKKDMIVVFNKVDLVDAPVVVAWKYYFKENFPKLHVMYFASYAGMKIKQGKKGKRIGNLHMAVEGSRHLLNVCETIVDGQVDLSSWHKKIEQEASEVVEEDYSALSNAEVIISSSDTTCYQESRYKDGVLTIGFVGHPNVGKSSFLNAVLGKKVVSVSRTPGHTKHYQTIMLTGNVRLCDCPGLVFPSLLPKPMQVLMGCYPISQVREPYSVIAFLAERVSLIKILNLRHPEFEPKNSTEELDWSSLDICTAFAEQRGFRNAKSARPDIYRAANNILRMALDGRTICLAFYPPDFFKNLGTWSCHAERKKVQKVQTHRSNDSLVDDIQNITTASSEDGSSDSDDNDVGTGARGNMFAVLSAM